MVTAILRSQDCLRGRFRHEALTLTLSPRSGSRRSPNFSNPNPNSAPNHGPAANVHQSRRRKRSPIAVQSNQHDRPRDRCADRSVVAKAPVKNLVTGQVKILRRGEVLNPEKGNRGLRVVASDDCKPKANKENDPDLVLGSTDRLGPDPETMQKQIKAAEFKVMDAIYAGSSAFYASPPPSSVPLPAFLGRNGTATSDLRRLLRLDLV
ncbi:hypothetical protein FF1_025965 [Malus domestica]|uniref:Uncharacterized protein n=1 Tax=Malus domestica TaxID=3750 RepID=A0A498KGS5_MALDO|nr:hypothetical protein DVH24_017646 [Malus domestica]